MLRTSRTLKLNKVFVFAVDFKMLPIRTPLKGGVGHSLVDPALGLASVPLARNNKDFQEKTLLSPGSQAENLQNETRSHILDEEKSVRSLLPGSYNPKTAKN